VKRLQCPVCLLEHAVTKGDTMMPHGTPRCLGTGQSPSASSVQEARQRSVLKKRALLVEALKDAVAHLASMRRHSQDLQAQLDTADEHRRDAEKAVRAAQAALDALDAASA